MSGFLRVDEEWELAMAETATFADARQLRCLFAYIIIGNEPSNVNELWEKFKEDMMQDYLYLHAAELRDASEEEAVQIREECEADCFNYINRILRDAGVDFADLLDDSEIYLAYEEEEADRGIPLPEGFFVLNCICFLCLCIYTGVFILMYEAVFIAFPGLSTLSQVSVWIYRRLNTSDWTDC
jgi:hypothetical protein